MKNFESQINVLQQKLNKLDNIQYLINDEDKCYILDQILENVKVDDLI